jgi:hypothetical protein
VIPLRGVECGAAELLDTVEPRDVRDVQRTHTRHEELRDVLVTCGGPDVPPLPSLVPGSAKDGLPEVGLRVQVVLDGEAFEVVEDLRLAGPHLRPVRVRREGE